MITVVGGINMDLSLRMARFPQPGETLGDAQLFRNAGGKGANQAHAIARLGGQVRLIGAVGDDSGGEELLSGFHKWSIDTAGVFRKTNTSTGTAVIFLDAEGQNEIVVAPCANAMLTVDDVASQRASIASSQAVVANLESPVSAVREAFRIARTNRVVTLLNPAPWKGCFDLLEGTDWLIPNENEAEQISGQSMKTEGDAAAAASRIRSMAAGLRVAITLGPRGVWIDSPEFVGRVPGFRVTPVDTVGAGDTWVGAFATELTRAQSIPAAARF
ncbi:MAG TPA: ribokinase, partial [Candidatus Limnocylindria bacterium]|nr:ribokinase [Candidatus Limnocylindria bacterium]